ncbi:MAG TPA: nitroreductase family protein [Ilumatobacteraceae bacterium]|nr:nitroreductase family protein [Ilumatobacteraceae bacterium]HRB05157.1 nitroreductase family protein [Ilumatobacteraceae bacterium]
MDLLETLRSNGAVRGFTNDPVSDDTVTTILDTARFAPSGGNKQPWRVAVVKDPSLRDTMAVLMRSVWEEYCGANAVGLRPFAFGRSVDAPPVAIPNALLDQIQSVPVVLAIAANLQDIAIMDGNLDRPPVVGGASIYPFCWSILLAARAYGLGGVMTTFLSRNEVAAGPALGLPADHALVATIFLGTPTHQNTKLRRRPVNSFTTVDRFDGESLQ